MDEKERVRLDQLMIYEGEAYQKGYCEVAGVDEAGRGPLAGPVVAAACILPPCRRFNRINDSKKLSVLLRRQIFELLTQDPEITYAIAIVDAEKIDEINIHQATLLAMKTALEKLAIKPDYSLVDGIFLPSGVLGRAIPKGDQLSQSIAAASILAKQTRDNLMDAYHLEWPQYGFNTHKGYPTKKHKEAIRVYGLKPIHRRTFRY